MRLLLATPYPVGSASGVSSFVRFLADAIRGRDGSVIIVAPRGSEVPESNLRLSLRSSLTLLRHREVQLVHCQQLHPQSIVLGLLGRILGKGVVLTVHGKSPRPDGIRGLVFDLSERLGAMLPHRLVFVAESMFVEAGGRGRVIPNGVPVASLRAIRLTRASVRRELGLDEFFVIAFVGRVTEDKGVMELLEAFQHVRASVSRPLRLVFVGPRDSSLRLNNEGAMNQDLLFLGYRSDAARCLAAADLFILPSHREGLPLSLLEAMAMGLPVVATSVGDIPKVVSDRVTGLLVPPKDADRLTDALLWILRHESEAKRMGEAAMRLVESAYDGARAWQDYRLLYDEVLVITDEGRRPPQPRS